MGFQNILLITSIFKERGAKDFLGILQTILPSGTAFLIYELKLLCFLDDWRYLRSPNKNRKYF